MLVDNVCVSTCSVFTVQKECAENYCVWEDNKCQLKCSYKTIKSDCENLEKCFWLEKNGTESAEECVNKV
jgi:hypothetical protein